MKRLLFSHLFLFSTLFSLENNLQEGFYSGTLVRTPKGAVCIEHIKPGDEVISYDETAKIYRINVVTQNIKTPATKPLTVTVGGVTFVAQNKHKIYTLGNSVKWQQIQDLKKTMAVLTYGNVKEIVNIHAADLARNAHPVNVYTLSVARDHNFLIGDEEGIIVHNVNPEMVAIAAEAASSLWATVSGFFAAADQEYSRSSHDSSSSSDASSSNHYRDTAYENATTRNRESDDSSSSSSSFDSHAESGSSHGTAERKASQHIHDALFDSVMEARRADAKRYGLPMPVDPRETHRASESSESSNSDKKGKSPAKEENESDKKPQISDAQAPGKPTEADGFIPPKNGDGKKVGTPKGYGWEDKKGNVWVPSGPKGHGGPHWDVQRPDETYDNVVPGGRYRGSDEKFVPNDIHTDFESSSTPATWQSEYVEHSSPTADSSNSDLDDSDIIDLINKTSDKEIEEAFERAFEKIFERS